MPKKAGQAKARMRVVTINLPEDIVQYLDVFVRAMGIFPSRSELCRWCVLTMLPSLRNEMGYVKAVLEEDDHVSLLSYMKEKGYNIQKVGQYKARYKVNGITDSKPLGNPFWEQYIGEEGKIYYRNKEDPDIIRIPLGNGKSKKIRRLGEA